MNINKKDSLLTFVSTAALLGLFSVTNGQTVHADTTNTPVVTNKADNQKSVDNSVDTDAKEGDTGSKVSKNETEKNNSDIAVKQDAINTPAADRTTDTQNVKVGEATDAVDNQVQNYEAFTTDTSSSEDSYVNYDSTPSVDVTPVSTTTTPTSEVTYNLSDEARKVLKEAEIDPAKLSQEQIDKINKIDFDGSSSDLSTKWTYAQYSGVAKKMLAQSKKYRVPYFNAKKIKNMPATRTKDAQTGQVADLEIWDSWPVQDDKTGKVVNYKGYQLMIAMMGIPKQNDAHIYLLYNKYNDNNLKNWKCAGPIFGFGATPTHQEWSGSATVNKNGTIQLFYTDVDTSKGDNHQKLSTVNLKLKVNKKKNTITIAKRSHRHVLFEGDTLYYQTYDQWKSTNKGADNVAMRDAHVISINGRRYLIFESSTGSVNYQGEKSIYNWQNYGGTSKEAMENFLKITSNQDMTSRATWANASIGILRLSKSQTNPKVDRVLPPLVTSLMVSDEIERPNLIKMNGKYYLFATTRLNRGTGDDLWQKADAEIGDNVAMLGWVSDYFDHGYKPLNGDGAVLVASVPFNWRTSTYSYYAVPVKGSKNELLVTAYMTNRGFAAGGDGRSTMAPAFIIKVNGDKTSVVQKATNQGDWVYDKKSVNKKMLVKTIKDAHLKGEPIDKSQLAKA